MSVKVKLEKNGYIKNGFTGFSWTTIFFGFWVPLFRLKLKDFLMFFIFFGFKIFVFYLFFYQISKNIYFPFLSSYATLIPLILFIVMFQNMENLLFRHQVLNLLFCQKNKMIQVLLLVVIEICLFRKIINFLYYYLIFIINRI